MTQRSQILQIHPQQQRQTHVSNFRQYMV